MTVSHNHKEVATLHRKHKREPVFMEDGAAARTLHLHASVGSKKTIAITQKQNELAEWVTFQPEAARRKFLEDSERRPSKVLAASHLRDNAVDGSRERLKYVSAPVDNRSSGVTVCPEVANPLFVCLLGVLSPVVIEINDRKVVR